MFRGRDKELNLLRGQLSSEQKSAVLVYGKRRVGKSTLISKALESYSGVAIYHTFVRSTFEGNLALLSRSICQNLNLPNMSFNTLFDLFDFLNAQNRDICVVLDEYQYLKNSLKCNEVDSFFQQICDRLSDKVKLIFCGSYISVMRELLLEENPLFGRFDQIVYLREMDYYEASFFASSLPPRDKVGFYSVFGGSPYVLCNIDMDKSIRWNIENKLLDKNSILRSHIENVMLSEVQKNYDVRILESLGNGKKKYSEIVMYLNTRDSGLLDKQLKNLINMDTIDKVYPINKSGDKKKTFYSIHDNLMRFYFAYIFGREGLIERLGATAFYEKYIADSIDSFINLRFEDIVVQYFIRRIQSDPSLDILDIGSYWYDNPKDKANGQFDCVVHTSVGYTVYEVKNYDRPMKLEECKYEAEQADKISDFSFDSKGFVCTGGFDFSSSEYELIDGEQLYLINY